jgi:hypothetical protein
MNTIAQIPAIDKLHSIVAVHGLNGHREASWTAPDGTLWLTDFLPTLIPGARIISYGYNAYTKHRTIMSTISFHNHAESFLGHLSFLRVTAATKVCLLYDLLCCLCL